MKVLVVVVTYNGMRWIDKCLGSVGSDCVIFVVDNASTDGSADYIATHYPNVIMVRNSGNTGFAAANNLGMQYALDHGFNYVYLLNQDAWLLPGAMDALLEAAGSHPRFGILSPMQMCGDGEHLDAQFAKLHASARPLDDGSMLEVRRVMAAHWLIRCDALREVGLFSSEFPMYGQDDDLCNRMRHAGWRVGIVPEATAIHDRAQRSEDKSKLIYRNYYMGSLVRLRDPGLPRWKAWSYIIPFTFIKAVKYRSLTPFHYLRMLISDT